MAGGIENPEKYQLSQGFCFLSQIVRRRIKGDQGQDQKLGTKHIFWFI